VRFDHVGVRRQFHTFLDENSPVNFDFPDDNKLVQDQIHRYLRDNCDLSVFRSVLEGNEGCATSVWQGLVEMAVQGSAIRGTLAGRAKIGFPFLSLKYA